MYAAAQYLQLIFFVFRSCWTGKYGKESYVAYTAAIWEIDQPEKLRKKTVVGSDFATVAFFCCVCVFRCVSKGNAKQYGTIFGDDRNGQRILHWRPKNMQRRQQRHQIEWSWAKGKGIGRWRIQMRWGERQKEREEEGERGRWHMGGRRKKLEICAPSTHTEYRSITCYLQWLKYTIL